MLAHRRLCRSAMAGPWAVQCVTTRFSPKRGDRGCLLKIITETNGGSMRRTRRVGIIGGLPMLLIALFASAAFAVAPGTYTPTSGSFNPANAPGSAHLASSTVQCVVNAALDVDCTNHGGNLVESHTTTFSDSSSATLTSSRNGQLRVPAQSASAFSAPQVCPNPNWTPSIRPGTLTLNSFTYTLTFAGFSSPYITITASDP